MSIRFTDSQKKIAKALLEGPLTMDALAQKTALPASELKEDIALLKQIKLITLDADQYALIPLIAEELIRRKNMEEEDDNPIHAHILIEVQGIESELVTKHAQKIIENLKKEPQFNLYAHHVEKVVKVEEQYSTLLDITLSVHDFRALVRLMFFYGPISVEITKPKKIEFTLDDFQNGLVDMTEMVHAYANYIMGILKRKDVETFNAKFYEGLRSAHALKETPPLEKNNPLDDIPVV